MFVPFALCYIDLVCRDSQLVRSGAWSKKIYIKRANGAEQLSVNLISQDYGKAAYKSSDNLTLFTLFLVSFCVLLFFFFYSHCVLVIFIHLGFLNHRHYSGGIPTHDLCFLSQAINSQTNGSAL